MTKIFALELPNGEKIQCESVHEYLLRKFVSKFYTKKYNEGYVTIPVKVYKVQVINFEVKLQFSHVIDVEPFSAPMTADDYLTELEKLLFEIPKEFRDFVNAQAYDRGHSSGYEECYNIAQDLVSALKDPIKNYTEKVKKICALP